MSSQFSGWAYPGHGALVENGKGRLREYIDHRRERERQVLEVLEGTGGANVLERQASQLDGIVQAIYAAIPEELKGAAERGLVQVLQKLRAEGKVLYSETDGTWSLNRNALL